MCGLIAALRADYLQSLVVIVDRDVVAQVVPECDMMPAVKAELPAFELVKNPSQSVCVLVAFLLLVSHARLLSGVVLTSKG